MSTETFDIPSTDYWFKVIEMLQQNWALITPNDAGGVTAHFIGDSSGVFDRLTFLNRGDAETALTRNGFRRYADDAHAQSFIRPPSPPFREQPHPNGPIYSSGRFWK